MKWVCEWFRRVSVVLLDCGSVIKEVVANLNAVLRQIIRHFGEPACLIYNVASSG